MIKSICIGIIFVVALTSCSTIRKATYPSDFTYISTTQVESTMTALAVSMDRIDRVLIDTTLDTDDRRDRILVELDKMETLGLSIAAGTQKTNHLVIDSHIDDFLADIRQARDASSKDPPNYYPLGRLSGSCRGCHFTDG